MEPVDPHVLLMKRCREMEDRELIREIKFMVERERRNLAGLLIHLAEYDRRKLYKDAGYPSLFLYCNRALGCDENTSFRLITACRVLRHYPAAAPLVAEGSLTLTAVLVLSPVLTDENHERLLKSARGKSRREIETLAAGESPMPARGDCVRRHPPDYPQWTSAAAQAGLTAAQAGIAAAQGAAPPAPGDLAAFASEAASAHPQNAFPGALEPAGAPPIDSREWQAVIPISLERVRIGFDAAVLVLQLLERARQVLKHKYPEGRVEDIMREALEFFLEKRDPQRTFALKAAEALPPKTACGERPIEPRFLRDWKAGRYIPAAVKRVVWARDEGRCSHRFEDGTVCGSREALEFDHLRPFAKGGRSEHPRNIRLLCRLHNGMASEASYGTPLSKAPPPAFNGGLYG